MALRNGRSGADWIRLPAGGRTGDPPAWPIPRPTKREIQLWAELWKSPQALMWEAKGQQLQVALYVRSLREAEKPGVPVASRTLLLRQEEYLGLSEPGLARNHWIIDAGVAAPAEGPGEDEGRPIPISDARERLRRAADG